MKHNIEGFDQKRLVELGLDVRSATVLRWFVDFLPNMTTVQESGKVFVWVKYDYVVDELPIIASNKYAIKRIFDKFVDIGLMEFFLWKNKGNYSTFRLVPEVYDTLISDTILAKVLEPSSKSANTPSSKSARTKDSSITHNHSIKSFIPPTLEQVEEYVLEKQLVINPKDFIDYYSLRDWHDSQGKQVKNWKSRALDWHTRELKKNPKAMPYSKPLILQEHNTAKVVKTCPSCGSELDKFNTCPKCHVEYDVMGRAI